MRTRWLTIAVVVWIGIGCDPEPGTQDAGTDDGDAVADATDTAEEPEDDTTADTSTPDTGDVASDAPDDGGTDADSGPGPVETEKLDLLWVIDNSGSMCQEQRELRKNLDAFVGRLAEASVDLQMSVTTTHMSTSTPFENVAEPGTIQSTPHPPAFFDSECQYIHEDSDGDGDVDPGEADFSPLRNQIEAAVACTKNPSNFQHLKNWTVDELRCAALNDCSNVSQSSISIEELFPCADKNGSECTDKSQFQQVYRDIPKVLKLSDYQNPDGTLDESGLLADFGCMSFVGTRGSPFEQGLHALREAVDPQMTGGPVSNPTDASAPNHGLIRKDAKFMAAIVTDENDCSHTGTTVEDEGQMNQCGELSCYFPTKSMPQDPLIPTSTLYSDVVSNLEDSKGISNLNESEDLLLASLHGDYRRYSQTIPNECDASQRKSLTEGLKVCSTDLGSARSGDRYADFISNASQSFPSDEKEGLICDSSLAIPLKRLGRFIP